jgi:hypothetical protein
MSNSRSDRYQLVRRIRTTPLGPSFEAHHPRRPGRFLVELLNAVEVEASAQVAFERDVMAVSALRHPYIVQVVEIAAMPDGTPVVVSELADGATLEARFAEGIATTPRGWFM